MRSSRIAAAVAAVTAALLAAPAAALAVSDVAATISDSPDPVTAGSNLTYSITVANGGPDPATNASLVATLPAGTTFVSLAAPGGWNCTTPPVGTGGTVTCTNGSLPVGSPSFTLVVATDAGLADGTVITQTVSSSHTDPDPNHANDDASATTTVTAPEADLFVTNSGSPNPAAVGDDVSYAISVGNVGPDAAVNTELSVPIPGGTMAFQSLIAPGGWSCTTPAVGATSGTISCTTPSLASGSSPGFVVVLQPTPAAAGQTIGVSATATSDTNDPSPVDASITEFTDVDPLPPVFRAPTVTGLLPGTGAPGTFVTIAGDGFAGTSEVRFGSARALFVVDGNDRINATVPAGTPGTTVEVVVVTPGGQSAATPVARFTYDRAPDGPSGGGGEQGGGDRPAEPRVLCRSLPDLAGKRLKGARRTLARRDCADATLRVRGKRRVDGKPNRIETQSPAPGTVLREGDRITVRMRPARG